MNPKRCNLLLIYGSQTGQSKSIAEDIKTKADNLNYDVEMLSMDESVEKVSFHICLAYWQVKCWFLYYACEFSDALERLQICHLYNIIVRL